MLTEGKTQYGWSLQKISTSRKSSKTFANTAYNDDYITDVMIESDLVEGRQDIPSDGVHKLVYVQSVTDACIDLEDTYNTLNFSREGVRVRRAARQNFEGIKLIIFHGLSLYNKLFCRILK